MNNYAFDVHGNIPTIGNGTIQPTRRQIKMHRRAFGRLMDEIAGTESDYERRARRKLEDLRRFTAVCNGTEKYRPYSKPEGK